MTTTEFDTEALAAKAIAALPKTVQLTYIDYRESFSDKNCAAIVGGDKDNVFDDGWDFSEGESHSLDMYLNDALPDSEERQALRDSDDYDTFREACYDRDDSTPYADVLRNTGSKLVRFYIRNRKGERLAIHGETWNWEDKQVERCAKWIASVCKLDYALNRDNLRELVQNATSGGVLCIIAYVEMRDIDKWVEHCLYGDERGRVELTFTNPHLLAHDSWNGSGHDVKVEGQIKIDFGRGALDPTHGVMALDAKDVGTGYSWDETAGPYKPAYKCDPAVRLYRASKGRKPDVPAPEAWPGR